MKHFITIILLFGSSVNLHAQRSLPDTLALMFNRQLEMFPHEKIALHTDKPYYISGEKIWFRAYLVDAVTHIPTFTSSYIFVELIDMHNSIISRVKIREENEVYHGHLLIPEDAPEGRYTLRTYSTNMRSTDEDYFSTKNIFIGNPKKSEEEQSSISTTNDEFDVGFYPEGGALVEGSIGIIAFKAMKSNGEDVEVAGTVYSRSGEEVVSFQSTHLGMGSFVLFPRKGERYFAVCETGWGQSKVFDLPTASVHGVALSVRQLKDNIHISLIQSVQPLTEDKFYLLAHTRGMIHLIKPWDKDRNLEVIPKGLFPSGVLHLILLDDHFNILSERLVFVNNQDQAQVAYTTDKEHYTPRSLVKNRAILTDAEGNPLSGTFSVSVTSDREILPDSTSNILTQLLLSSELRGVVHNPAYYFRNSPESSHALDLLMLTNGWRRYDVSNVVKGHYALPIWPLDAGDEISGKVTSVLLGKSVENIEVNVISLSLAHGFSHSTQTNNEGRFHIPIAELPDSTTYMVSVEPRRGMTRMNLTLDDEFFPERTLSTPPFPYPDRGVFDKYAHKAEMQRVYENDGGATLLKAAVVTANRIQLRKSAYYNTMSRNVTSITEDQMEKLGATSTIYALLDRLPGVQATFDGNTGGHHIYIRGPGARLGFNSRDPREMKEKRNNDDEDAREPLLVVDNMVTEIKFLKTINVHDIAQIDVLTGADCIIFGGRGMYGVISIFTKNGSYSKEIESQPSHLKTIVPLGYQRPVAFYAPKYETQAQGINNKPDLRTTIHWQPVVQLDSRGGATFEFYSADEQTSYTVTIVGVADDGTIIRHEGKVWNRALTM